MTHKVLVVDDSESNRKLARAVLDSEGYEVLEAVDGVDGLGKAMKARPDLVISDILMPTMDGYEFVRRLRAMPQLAETAVIFYTANYHEREAQSLAEQCGVARIVVKPSPRRVFLAAVREVLQGAGAVPSAPLSADFDAQHLRVVTDKLSRTAEDLRISNSRFAALNELNVQLASERDPRTLLAKVCAGARNLLATRWAVLVVNERGSDQEPFAVTSGAGLGELRVPSVETGALAKVFRERTPLRSAGTRLNLGLPPPYDAVGSVLAVAVTSLTRTYGWLCLGDKLGAPGFSAEDESMLRTLGAQVGRIYENGSLYLEVQEHATRLLTEIDERERAVQGLRASEEQFRQIAENIHDVFFITAPDLSRHLYVSPAYEEIWGRPVQELIDNPQTWMKSLHADDRASVLRAMMRITAALPEPGALEFRIVRPDGSIRWILSRLFAIVANGAIERVVGVAKDVTSRKLATAKIEHLNRVHKMLSGINSLIVREPDRDELFSDACKLAVDEGGFEFAWCGLVDGSGKVAKAVWAARSPRCNGEPLQVGAAPGNDTMVAASLRTLSPIVCNDLTQERTYGLDFELERCHSAVALPLILNGKAAGCLFLMAAETDFFDDAEMRLLNELSGDISFALDHTEKAERLNYLALYDSLTGLANRTLFTERVAQNLLTADQASSQLAVLMADPERFDSFNDTFGRAAGDELLREIAARFARAVGTRDRAARIGSDQFAAVITGTESDVARAVETIWPAWLDEPFMVNGQAVKVTAKAGVALYPADGKDPETLLRNAEAALRTAKSASKPYAFYTAELSGRLAERLTLERNLRRALEEEEFVVHYQPKVDLETRRVRGLEALIRWNSPEFGLVPPAKFIPLMESNGMIVEVGAWVLRQAAADRSRWIEQRLKAPRVAVNVSTAQLRRDDFVRTFVNAIRLAGPDPGLDIEVTESLLAEDIDDNIEKLTAIRDRGIGIALDDFGTGYSSLGYLAKLPVQTLKIDRSFITTMLNDPGAMTLVSTIISLANSLKLETVAEGVESEEQAKILRLLRCGQMQGYLVSKPLPFDEMTTYLGRSRV